MKYIDSEGFKIITGITIALFVFFFTKWLIPFIISKRNEYKALRKQIADDIAFIKKQVTANGDPTTMASKLTKLEIDFKIFKDDISLSVNGLSEEQRILMIVRNLAFWETDKDNDLVFASPKLCEVMDRTESDLMKKDWTLWITERDRKRVFSAYEKHINEGLGFDEKYTILRRDGLYQNVHGKAFRRKHAVRFVAFIEPVGEPTLTLTSF